ncbi:MAG: hypothetical protein ACYTFI_24040, partial [Planctomycetota bacterium]
MSDDALGDQAIPDAQPPLDAPARPRRRWWVVPLAGFMCFLTVPGFYMYRYVRRRRAIAALEALGHVTRGRPKPRPWPMSLLPKPDAPVHSIILVGGSLDDAALARVAYVAELERLILFRTPVTDAGLVHLKGLT